MGPTRTLLKLGAEVLAIDLNGRPQSWQKLTDFAKGTAGRLRVPVPAEAVGKITDMPTLHEHAGCNLIEEWPSVLRWLLKELELSPKRPVLGVFVYADGGVFARLAAACDMLVSAVLRERPDTALIGLCSPTEVCVLCLCMYVCCACICMCVCMCILCAYVHLYIYMCL